MDNQTAQELAFDEFITHDRTDGLFEKVSGDLSDVLALSKAAFRFGWKCGIRYEEIANSLPVDIELD